MIDLRINNGLAFLFSETKYEVTGVQIQKLVYSGITTTLKGNCLYNNMNINPRQNSAWNIDQDKINNDFIDPNNFFGCINLKDLFGSCEDYKHILINCNQQLTMNRAT